MMTQISTDTLHHAGRAKAWNHMYSGLLAAADFIPSDDDFSAGVMLSQVGRLAIARLSTGRCTIRRTAAHIDRRAPQLFSLLFQASGRGLFVQGRHNVVLDTGDIALCNHALPHMRSLENGAEILILRVPGDIIATYLPHVEALCGLRLPAGAGLMPTAGAVVRTLWRRIEQGIATDYEDCLAHHALQMVSTSYAMAFGAGLHGDDPGGRTMLAVQHHVESRLHDPDFKPAAIAQELAMPPFELHGLFGARGESLRAYVTRRRLEEAARRLRDPRWRGHTVAEIAHCCGFVSTALFARSFRARYAMTPTDYRESC